MAPQMDSPKSMSQRLAEFRLIPRIETFPWAVSFAQTWWGRAIILALFGLGLCVFYPSPFLALFVTLIIAFMTFMPEYRHLLLAVTPIVLVVLQSFKDPLHLSLNLSVIALGSVLYWCAMRWPKSHFGQRPVAYLLVGFTALILSACAATPHTLAYSILWDLVGLMAVYIWFIAYALADRSSKPARDLPMELATFRPLWGSSNTPFPKGAAYLRRIEAQNQEQLAIVQLKGLKLLAWAILLFLFSNLWYRFFHGYLHIPMPDDALAMSVRGTPVAWHLCWESQILAYFELVLSVSIFGHYLIATCRMAGFNALRNTYRPLSSATLMEFFNRFYYYFKELLVDFFFFPTFLRYWKKHRRVRTVFATFAAVVFGNSFYHFTRDWHFIQSDGLLKSIVTYDVSIVYNVVLATGLSISQLRKRGPRHAGFLRGRLLPSIGVCFFYTIVLVFGSASRVFSIMETLRYLASMFFIHF
jgi:hypothetical protein